MKRLAARLQSGDSVAKTRWERVATKTWGAYISEVEGRARSAIDLGCERRIGPEDTCTDVNEASLELCQKRLPAAECVLMQSEETRLPLA